MDSYEERRMTRTRRSKKKGGPLYFDIILIIAVYLSVAGFTGLKDLYTICQPGTLFYYVCMVSSVITSAAPMLVFMVAGAKILPREESTRYNVKNRVLPLLLLLVIFSFIYYQSDVKLGRDVLDLGNFFLDLYARDRVAPYSFVYGFLGFLISLPLLRPMAQYMRNRDFIYLFVLVFILRSVLPFADDIFFLHKYELNSNIKLEWVVDYIVVYPLAGYFVHQRADKSWCKKALPWMWLITVVWFAVVVWRTYSHVMFTEYIPTFCGYHEQVFLPLCLSFFVSLRLIFETKHKNKLFSQIAATGYGIFLAQEFFRDRGGIIQNWRDSILDTRLDMGRFFAYHLWALIICLMTGVVVWIVQRLYAALMRKE